MKRRRSEPTTEVVVLSKPIIAPAVANAVLWAPRKRAGDGCWTEAASDKFRALLPDCLVASLPSPAAPITSKASSASNKSLDHPKDPADQSRARQEAVSANLSVAAKREGTQ